MLICFLLTKPEEFLVELSENFHKSSIFFIILILPDYSHDFVDYLHSESTEISVFS